MSVLIFVFVEKGILTFRKDPCLKVNKIINKTCLVPVNGKIGGSVRLHNIRFVTLVPIGLVPTDFSTSNVLQPDWLTISWVWWMAGAVHSTANPLDSLID